MKKRYVILLAILFLLGFTVVFPPDKNYGQLNLETFISETNPPDEVQHILKNSCFDCHSNQTKYPLYYKYPVLNYWLAHHVDKGKEHLNFSEWANYNKYQKEYTLKNCISELKSRKMPLNTYLIKHPDSRLTEEQTDLVVNWVESISDKFKTKRP